MSQPFKIEGRLLVKNTVLNFIGQVIPLLVGVVTVPFIIRGLGVERFGVLAIALVVLGYFSLFDLGHGRATTKFVSEALGKGKVESIPAIMWTSLTSQFLLSILCSVSLFLVTPILVGRILNIPLSLLEESKDVFYILSLAIPIVINSACMFGALEASQRFDLVNAVKIPSSTLTFRPIMMSEVADCRSKAFGYNVIEIVNYLLNKKLCLFRATSGGILIKCGYSEDEYNYFFVPEEKISRLSSEGSIHR